MSTLTYTDNLQGAGGMTADDAHAVRMVPLATGALIMISSERETSSKGVATDRIGNDPGSVTCSQIIGGAGSVMRSAGAPFQAALAMQTRRGPRPRSPGLAPSFLHRPAVCAGFLHTS